MNLRNIVKNPRFQRGLCRLYKYSSSECRDASGNTPDVGTMRERDLVRALIYNGLSVTRDFQVVGGSRADCIIEGHKVSIKHYTTSTKKQECGNKNFKLTWTADKDKATCDMMKIVKNGVIDDMLIVKLNVTLSTVTVFFISAETLNKLIKQHAWNIKLFFNLEPVFDLHRVFNCKTSTNDRGIEFNSRFIQEFYKNCEWSETFKGDFIGDPRDADVRRDKMLVDLCS